MKSILITLLFFASFSMYSQTLKNELDGSEKGLLLSDFLSKYQKDKSIKFFYLPEWFGQIKIDNSYKGIRLSEMLNSLVQGTEIAFVELYGYAIIFYKDPAKDLQRDFLIESAAKKKVQIDHVVIGSETNFKPGKKVVLRGTIVDQETKIPMGGATVHINGFNIGFTTDTKGKYEIAIPEGEYLINYSYVNYEEKLINLKIYGDGQVNLSLSENAVTLQEVVVSDQMIVTKGVGQITLKMTDLKRTPSFLGMADLIKQVQTQPGVSTVSEASSGFNVRGGGVDQNLVLFDGVPILNTSHALGFFTAFNAEAINQATFYKGGIPAEYGGRVSSVLNIAAKEGDYEKWKGTGGIGLISADLTIGGPIKRDTSSLIVSFRSSYSDWILNLLRTRYRDIQKGSVAFYDGALKYSHKFSKKSKLTLSSYTSSDEFKLANDTTNQWQNIAVSIRYDHNAFRNISYSAGLYFGKYSYNVKESDPPTAFNLNYNVVYPSFKLDFNHEGGAHKQTFGLHTTFYNFSPGHLKATSNVSNVKETIMPVEKSFETALYISDGFHVNARLNIDLGFRLSMFNRIGPGSVNQYASDKPMDEGSEIKSVNYKSGQIMKTYIGPEPRLSMKFLLGQQSSLKLGYNRIYQYIHLISNTASVTPVDIWQSSNTYFKPQRADQISFGYFRDSKSNTFEAYGEVFYKTIKNLLDFKDGANLILNSQLETSLLKGIGKAYGAEFSISKLKGKLVGGINYTYSRSLRKVNGNFDSEKINNGSWYPSNYDQPNIINVNWRYNLTNKVFFTGAFTYHTGRPVSLPISGYIINNVPVTNFSSRNNYRIPDYHRLDIALVIEGSPRKKKYWEGSWIISLYNVYGRKNPYSLFFVDQGGGVLKPYQLSLVGTVVPSLTYRFKF